MQASGWRNVRRSSRLVFAKSGLSRQLCRHSTLRATLIDGRHADFLPALEKMGKTCQVTFVQTSEQGTDGALIKLEMPSSEFFSTFMIESRKDNLIAFTLNVTLLIRILSSARAIETESIEGLIHSMEQELPISMPFTPTAVDELLAKVGALALMDWYVDVKAHIPRMEALLNSLRQISAFVTVLSTRAGELHLQVQADSIVQGIEVGRLHVYPPHEGENAVPQTALTPDLRFLGAMNDELNSGPRAELQSKQFLRALAACQLVEPSMLMLAVGDANRPVVHLMCVFHGGGDGDMQDDLALHVWLPVREDGD